MCVCVCDFLNVLLNVLVGGGLVCLYVFMCVCFVEVSLFDLRIQYQILMNHFIGIGWLLK